MPRSRSLVIEVLRNLLLADLGLAVVFFGQYHLSGGTDAIWRALVLPPLFFLTVPIRGIRHRVWRFLLPCLAYFALLYGIGRLLPSQPPAAWLEAFPFLAASQPVLFAFFAVYALVITVYERFFKPAGITIGYLIASVMFFFFLYLNAPADSPLRVALHFLSVFHLVFFVIHMQMENFASAMFRYAESGNQPVDRISTLGNSLLAGFLVFLGVVALFAPYGATAVTKLLNGLLAAIRFVVGLFRFGGGETTPTTVTPATEPPGETGGGLPAIESSAFWSVIMQIIEILLYVVLVAVLLAVIAGFFYALYRLYRRFYTDRSVDGDVRIRLTRTASDRTRVSGTPSSSIKKPRRGLGATPADRIRRLLSRTGDSAVKSRRAEVRDSDTAGIISDKVSHGLHRDLGSLPGLYDKARYGPEGAVTREDVKDAATIAKRNP